MLISYIQNAMKLANYEILEETGSTTAKSKASKDCGRRQIASKPAAKNCKAHWKIGLYLACEWDINFLL